MRRGCGIRGEAGAHAGRALQNLLADDEDGTLLGEYGAGGSQSSGTSQYNKCGVARYPALKTASFWPGLRCKSSRYQRVSLRYAPCPDPKSIGFHCAAQRAPPHYLPTASGPLPIAAVIKGTTYAVHSDHLNTPRKLTQANGQVAWQWAYSAFGDEQPTLGAKRFTSETTTPPTGTTSIPEVTFNLRYPGQYFDKETKLHYNYFRSYDSRTGRYTQGDPIGLDGGWNRFGYVGGDPLSYTDPKGLIRICTVPGGCVDTNPPPIDPDLPVPPPVGPYVPPAPPVGFPLPIKPILDIIDLCMNRGGG